jgi:hypothetical protein
VRLDHLLSKECHRPLSKFGLRRNSPITTQLNTGYSAALAYRQMDVAAFDDFLAKRQSPSSTERSLRGAVGLSLFRFEGAALLPFVAMAGPGDVPTGAGSRPCLARVELRVSSPGSGRLRTVHGRTAHPVRALVGLLFSPGSLWLIRGPRSRCATLRARRSAP